MSTVSLAKWVNNVREKAEKHPILFGLILAVLFSVILSTPYLIQSGIKISFNGRFGDMFAGLPFVIERHYIFNRWGTAFYVWGPFYSQPNFFGDSNFFMIPQLLIYTIIPNVVLSYKVLDILLFFTSFFTMYLLAYTISSKKRVVSGVVAALFYSLTPYLLMELITHQYMMFGYALLPLAYFSIYKALVGKTRKYMWVCLAGISIAASSIFPSLEYIYVNGISLFLFSLILCFKGIDRTSIKILFSRLISVVVMFSIAILLSAYFVLPMLFSTNPFLTVSVFSRVAQVPRYSSTFVEAAFLLDKGVDIRINYFDVYGLLIIPFAFPIILSSSMLVLKRKNINLVHLLFFLLGTLALLFSMGSNLPDFLRIFQYASDYLPLFSMNRTPCRFTLQIALSFSLLGGIAIGLACERLRNFTCASLKAVRHSYKPLFTVLAIAIMLGSYVFSGGTLTYSVVGPYQSQPMPESAPKVVAWLNQDDPNQDYRIIDLTQTHIIASYHRSLLNGPDLILKYWCSPSLARTLGMLNVKYIITDNYSYINEKLLNLPNFYCVTIDQDLIFVNTLAKEEIYCSNGALAIGGPNVLSTFYATLDGTVSSMKTSYATTSHQSISSANWALFGPDILAEQSSLNQFHDYNAIVFADSDLRDLVFQQLDSNYKFEAWKYLNADWSVVDCSSGVEAASAEFYQNAVNGQLVLSHRAIYSDSKTTLQIPINVNGTGLYDVWVRASNFFPSETTDVISTSIDGSLVGQADFGKVGGFKWLLVNDVSIQLSKGFHVLNLFTSGNPVYLDMVAVVPIGVVDSATTEEIASIANIPQMYILEFSNYFVGSNASKQEDVLPFASSSSAGYLVHRPSSSGYLTLEPDSIVTQHLFVAKADSYVLNLRFLNRPDGGIFSVKIDGMAVNKIKTNGSLQWSWTNASSIYLTSGEHEIEVTSESGNNSIDIMSLIENSLLTTLMVEPGTTQFSNVHLNMWQGTLNYTKPAFVVFAESYYPEWVFKLQTSNSNIVVPPLEVFYFLNAYPVDSIGVSEFSVYHETSQIRNISFAATFLTFIACMIVITIEVLRVRIKSIGLRDG